ncbi:hypothetical protein PENSPDRAFT_35564 [Peniophora sp. CONT]|nr:hypothetical protein PENSPDRAFT_35564 [Peniophora sp. CONT]
MLNVCLLLYLFPVRSVRGRKRCELSIHSAGLGNSDVLSEPVNDIPSKDCSEGERRVSIVNDELIYMAAARRTRVVGR